VRRARLGVTFNDRWFCSQRCLEMETRSLLAELRHHEAWLTPPSPPVGRLLVQRQGLDPAAIEAALRRQRVSGRRLGAELVAMGAVSNEAVLRALAAQAGVGCLPSLDPSRVAAGPGGLPRRIVEALRVVPFEALPAQQRLLVACASPLPRAGLTAVREMTGWRVEPYLVPDEVLDRLVEAYARGDALEAARAVRSVPDAAASIARAAVAGAVRRMHPVRCDPWVWVRLEGDAHAEDLMVALDLPRKETTWQVAPTPH
jgi:hypothetical protein